MSRNDLYRASHWLRTSVYQQRIIRLTRVRIQQQIDRRRILQNNRYLRVINEILESERQRFVNGSNMANENFPFNANVHERYYTSRRLTLGEVQEVLGENYTVKHIGGLLRDSGHVITLHGVLSFELYLSNDFMIYDGDVLHTTSLSIEFDNDLLDELPLMMNSRHYIKNLVMLFGMIQSRSFEFFEVKVCRCQDPTILCSCDCRQYCEHRSCNLRNGLPYTSRIRTYFFSELRQFGSDNHIYVEVDGREYEIYFGDDSFVERIDVIMDQYPDVFSAF